MTIWDRWWDKVDVTDGCWNWTGGTTLSGYALIGVTADTPSGTTKVPAYRLSYQWFKGPIPEGHEIDHACRNRRCVNPDHLQVVTHRENMVLAAVAHTHCRRGHRYPVPGHVPGGKRCQECRADRKRAISAPAS